MSCTLGTTTTTFHSAVIYNPNNWPIMYTVPNTYNPSPPCNLTIPAKTARDVPYNVYVCDYAANGHLCQQFGNNPGECRLKDGVCYTQVTRDRFVAWDGSQKK